MIENVNEDQMLFLTNNITIKSRLT